MATITRAALLAALATAASAGVVPPLNPTAPPGPGQAAQARPNVVSFSQEFLDSSFAAFMATNPPVAQLNITQPMLVEIGCNQNVAPKPLKWKMWCANGPALGDWPVNMANVTEWANYDGTYHRKIVLAPQPGLTGENLVWFTSGLSSPDIDWAGRKWYWYELWHPTDHIESKNRIATPAKDDALRARAQTLIHERYVHAPVEYTGPNTYETNAWYTALNPNVNWAAHRQEIALFTQGHQAETLILSVEDTPAGGVVTAELVLGVPAKGSDPVNPGMGVPLQDAVAANTAAFIPYFQSLRNSGTYGPGFDALSRHVVEEFSNLGRFVPEIYESFKANPAGAVPGGSAALGLIFNITNKVPQVFMKNDTLFTVGMPLSVPGPKRSPVVLPYLANATAEKLEEVQGVIDAKLMALQFKGRNHTV